jgi:nucleoside-diphosphate-sugar epimerase
VIVGSHARLTRDTGWTPEVSLDATLDALIEYWRAEVAGRPL